ncbi:MAG: hypothetical protein ABSH32_27135 [Bryobacteraceae bacterium]
MIHHSTNSNKLHRVFFNAIAFIFLAALCQAQTPPPYTITTFAGNCVANSTPPPPCASGYAGDGGAAASAQFAGPDALAVDSSGNLYISDTGNQRIRKVSGGSINTVAGNGTQGYSGDKGSATSAEVDEPSGLAFDSNGNLYIGDTGNFVVREVESGNIFTIAGTNSTQGFQGNTALGDGGAATSGELDNPSGMAVDSGGNIYIADPGSDLVRIVCNNQTPAPCKTLTAGDINTFAGVNSYGAGYSGDGGPSTAAQLNNPIGLALDAQGNLYIADTGNNLIRKVTAATGIITTVAGNGGAGYSGDGGLAISAELNTPKSVAVDANGYIYIADSINSVIRAVAPDGTITTIAGNGIIGYSGDGGPATGAALYFPSGVAVSGGKVYIADSGNNVIRLLTPVVQNPVVNANGVVNSGSYSSQGVAPGSIVSIFGTTLAGSTSAASSIPLPTSLSDVISVTFNNIPAPLYFVSGQQINAQLPWNVLTSGASGTVNVVVTRSTGVSTAQSVSVVPAAPGIFTVSNNGLGQAYAYDNTTGAVAGPAGTKIGSLQVTPISLSSGHALIIPCTGLGAVTPSIANGAAAPNDTTATQLMPTVLIGGVQAKFVYSVLSPQYVSEYQIGVIPDPSTPVGDTVSLQIEINGVTTPTTSGQVTIAVAQ